MTTPWANHQSILLKSKARPNITDCVCVCVYWWEPEWSDSEWKDSDPACLSQCQQRMTSHLPDMSQSTPHDKKQESLETNTDLKRLLHLSDVEFLHHYI